MRVNLDNTKATFEPKKQEDDKDWERRVARVKTKRVAATPRRPGYRVVKIKRGRKIVVNRPIMKQSSKVPQCREHKTNMKMNIIRGVWECVERANGCPIVARPKQDNEGSNIILGKGKVELRVFYLREDGRDIQRVMVVTDNNVAVDITDYVAVETIARTFDTEAVMREAKADGKTIARVSVQKSVNVTLPLSIYWTPDGN